MRVFSRLVFFAFLLISSNLIAQNWVQADDFPGISRDDGVCFTIGANAFCGTGRAADFSFTRDFYSFNFQTNTWSPIASLPVGEERQYACGFSHNQYGYIFGGVKGDEYLNDLWRYNSQIDQWEELTSLPGARRAGSSYFQIDGIFYVIGGRNDASNALSEVWTYNPQSNQWAQKNNIPWSGTWRGGATSANGKGYLSFGLDEESNYNNLIWEYDPSLDTWTEIAQVNTGPRNYNALFHYNNQLIVAGGLDFEGNFLNEVISYNPLSQEWNLLEELPGLGRRGGMYFQNENSIFYATGLLGDLSRTSEVWRLDLVLSTDEISAHKILVYPNPCRDQLSIHGIENFSDRALIEVFTIQGNLIDSRFLSSPNSALDVSNLPEGFYLLKISNAARSIQSKFVKLN